MVTISGTQWPPTYTGSSHSRHATRGRLTASAALAFTASMRPLRRSTRISARRAVPVSSPTSRMLSSTSRSPCGSSETILVSASKSFAACLTSV